MWLSKCFFACSNKEPEPAAFKKKLLAGVKGHAGSQSQNNHAQQDSRKSGGEINEET